MTDCPFCRENWCKLTIVESPVDDIAIIKPLEPVTPGHLLVISGNHAESAAEDPSGFSDLAYIAAYFIHREGIQANIITSIGFNATQSVKHTHVHIVPRTPVDHLPLPWTPQHEVRSLERALRLKQMLQESGDAHTVGLFQQVNF